MGFAVLTSTVLTQHSGHWDRFLCPKKALCADVMASTCAACSVYSKPQSAESEGCPLKHCLANPHTRMSVASEVKSTSSGMLHRMAAPAITDVLHRHIGSHATNTSEKRR